MKRIKKFLKWYGKFIKYDPMALVVPIGLIVLLIILFLGIIL